jgi:septal ring factor EnvC (AmiA/AmiB activator)
MNAESLKYEVFRAPVEGKNITTAKKFPVRKTRSIQRRKEGGLMKSLKIVVWGSLVFGSLWFATDSAFADGRDYGRRSSSSVRQELARDRAEIRDSRQDFRGDLNELARDRRELWQDWRNGASRAEIARDRAEIRQDLKELEDSRRDLRGDLNEYYRDLNANGRRGGYYDRGDWRYDYRPYERSSWWGYTPWWRWR